MKDHKILILDQTIIQSLVDIPSAIAVVESAFRELGLGRVQMPPKMYLHLDKYNGDFRAMPAYVEKLKTCALKWVNVHPGNRRLGLPAVMAVIIVSDPRNGLPLCIMDGTLVTSLRTGAAGGVAAKYLARKDSGVIALVGCGAQARAQLEVLARLFKIKEVRVWGCEKLSAKKFISAMKHVRLNIICAGDVRRCVDGADIVVTTTPSRKPLVDASWIKSGAHINAIGADARGKQELDPRILKNAKVVVDLWEQASHSGEINVPFAKGIITRKDIYADIGSIAAGKKRGRSNNEEITVFDSTGLAVQDAAVADLIFQAALKKKKGRWVKLM